MKIFCEQLNPHACKTYLVGIEGSPEVAFIDPVIEHVNDYADLVKKRGLKVSKVIDTHSHADHISGGASLKDMLGCDYVMHTLAPSQCANFRVQDGFEWKLFNKIPIRILYTPGHTKDSMSLVFPDRVFTGDALFLDDGGAGRDDLPGGDPGEHWETLQKLLALPENLVVYPAHDYRNRTPSRLKQQKKTNPHLKPRTKQEFINYINDLKLGPADWMKNVLKANYACAHDPKAAWIPADAPACEVKGTLEPNANQLQVSSLPPKILKQKMEGKEDLVLLDVREADELVGPLGHLPGIVHMPIAGLAAKLAELEKYKGKEIVTVCRSGGRATTAAQILGLAGFPKVEVLAGGMLAWREEERVQGMKDRGQGAKGSRVQG
ncbi:MAG: MBL fold metallo-hydrolase [Desulfobacteraceae bacterium]|nr:MAG: MBL fold metallo-hydrolase [Desulfobacteraceae bacterium]